MVWEEAEERTSEIATLSVSFMVFMVLAALIAAVGIFLDSEVLLVGGMVVGIAAAYADWPSFRGSLTQLGVNFAALLLAGTLTLALQRTLYAQRRRRHLRQ